MPIGLSVFGGVVPSATIADYQHTMLWYLLVRPQNQFRAANPVLAGLWLNRVDSDGRVQVDQEHKFLGSWAY